MLSVLAYSQLDVNQGQIGLPLRRCNLKLSFVRHVCLTVLCVYVGLTAPLQAQTPTPAKDAAKPLMEAKQVVPNVYYVQGVSELGSSANQNFISNAAFVVTPAGVV